MTALLGTLRVQTPAPPPPAQRGECSHPNPRLQPEGVLGAASPGAPPSASPEAGGRARCLPKTALGKGGEQHHFPGFPPGPQRSSHSLGLVLGSFTERRRRTSLVSARGDSRWGDAATLSQRPQRELEGHVSQFIIDDHHSPPRCASQARVLPALACPPNEQSRERAWGCWEQTQEMPRHRPPAHPRPRPKLLRPRTPRKVEGPAGVSTADSSAQPPPTCPRSGRTGRPAAGP